MARPLVLAPRRVFDGFGYAVRAVSPYVRPRDGDELGAVMRQAAEEGVTVGLRANGRSYGDAALNGAGVIVDMSGMDRVLGFDRVAGIVDVEPGVTIERLWRSTLAQGWWPTVVPGTMHATLGGCAAMNVHGKNHFRVGGTGDSVLEFDLMLPDGSVQTVTRTSDPELFHGAIGGFGLLGVFTRIRLQMKQVETGRLKVWQIPCRNLDEQFEVFQRHEHDSDYLVSWVDGIAGGDGLGRGQIHRAIYQHADEDPAGVPMLEPERQDLPGTILGVPRSLVGSVLAAFNFDLGMRFVNFGKYVSAAYGSRAPYAQGHVAFSFLLDYVPTWRAAYTPGGFIQYQPFLPKETAKQALADCLRLSQARGIVTYLGVLKRHRPDTFLMSHALDGYSLAMDFPVTTSNRDALWRLCHDMNEIVVDAGGRFYPAKDATMRPQDLNRAWGQERIAAFQALRGRVDPAGRLRTELAARVGLMG